MKKQILRKLIPPILMMAMRALAFTLRFRLQDRCGVTRRSVGRAVIWSCWHNRILMCPAGFARYFPGRKATVLTSASSDGTLLAKVMGLFGIKSVRGSSSSGGSNALRQLATVLKAGGDVVITPDGPRGPVYKLHPGIVKLAQTTGAPIVPVHIHYSRFWTLRSWDGFRIPKPFSRVIFELGSLHQVASARGDGGSDQSRAVFDGEMARLEEALATGAMPG